MSERRAARILIVDDDPAIRRAVRIALTAAGEYAIDEAEDGETALKCLGQACPDLVMLDLILPGLSGQEVCRRLRTQRGAEHIYIIMLTALGGVSDKVHGLDTGADDYVVKPFHVQELLARVRRGLRIAAERRLAEVDFLTDLPNRRALEAALVREAEAASRYGRKLAFLMVDVDHFKRVNDTYGHDAGDAVLKELAAVLREQSRLSDLPARWGGEEFALVLSDTDMARAGVVAERVRQAVAERAFPIAGSQTVSIGVAGFCGEVVGMIARADEALYRAKREGRNRAVVADA